MLKKSLVAIAVLSATSVCSAEVLTSPITENQTLTSNVEYSIENNSVLSGKGSSSLLQFNMRGHNATLEVSTGNSSPVANVDVFGNGKGDLVLKTKGTGLYVGTNKFHDLNSLTINAGDKAMAGYSINQIENVKEVTINAVDDAMHRGGDASGNVRISGFDKLLVHSKNGYAIQDVSSSDKEGILIEGNVGSVATFKSDTKLDTIALFYWNNKTDVEPKLAVKAGTINVINGNSRGNAIRVHKKGIATFTADKINIVANTGVNVLDASTVNMNASEIDIDAKSKGLSLNNASTVSINADTISIESEEDALYSSEKYTGTLTFGSIQNSSTSLTIKGDVNLAGGNSVFNGTNINLSAANIFNVANLSGNGSTLLLNGFVDEGATVSITDNNATDFAIKASGKLNDQYSNPEELLNDLKSNISITNQNTKEEIALGAEAGSVAEGWYINENGELVPTGNPSMNAVANFSAMTLAQWRGEMNHLSMRLGDIRVNSADIGAWVRAYGYENQVDDLVSIKMKTNSIQTGVDVRLNNNWVVGGAFSYTDSEADFTNGEGNSDGYTLAAYATGYFDCGGYIDVIGRVGRLSSDVKADTLSVMGGVLTGDYDNTALSLSVETGYHWKVNDVFYIEPQAELAYGIVFGDDFTSATNGVRIEQDDFESLVGRLGTRFGATFNEGRGQLYAHASINHDFMGDADATATPSWGVAQRIGTDLGATWVSFGVGAQFDLKNNLTFYGSLERSNGSDYDEDYRYSVGARYTF